LLYRQAYRGHILIAEDNPVNMMIIRANLTKMGFQVIEASNGKDAVKKFAEHGKILLIFMDIHMPEMDGFEATHKIREYENGIRHTPIIALTADSFNDDRDKCLAEGMDFHISKPFRPRDIINVLEQFLPASSQAEPEVSRVYTEEKINTNDNVERDVNIEITAPVFDRDELLVRIGNHMDLYHNLIAAFLERVPDILSDLSIKIATEELEAIRFNAHSLKGISLSVGAGVMSKLSEEIEKACGSGEIESIRNIFKSLQPAFKDFCDELAKYN